VKYSEIKEMIELARRFVDLMDECEVVFEDKEVGKAYEEFKDALELTGR
jgi:hypothetical protein